MQRKRASNHLEYHKDLLSMACNIEGGISKYRGELHNLNKNGSITAFLSDTTIYSREETTQNIRRIFGDDLSVKLITLFQNICEFYAILEYDLFQGKNMPADRKPTLYNNNSYRGKTINNKKLLKLKNSILMFQWNKFTYMIFHIEKGNNLGNIVDLVATLIHSKDMANAIRARYTSI